LALLAARRAGIRPYHDDMEAINGTHYPSVTASLPPFADDPLVAAPGSRFGYSNSGYVLLSAAIDGAAREPFLEVMRKEAFEPLGVERPRLTTWAVRSLIVRRTMRSRRCAPPLQGGALGGQVEQERQPETGCPREGSSPLSSACRCSRSGVARIGTVPRGRHATSTRPRALARPRGQTTTGLSSASSCR
jgi:CubicO group peptidase (beta-lactamase class C family)